MEKNKGGRARIVLSDEDWKKIAKMCEYHCTAEEIADIMGFSADTLDRRLREKYGCGYAEYYKRYSAEGKMSLRRAQYKNAVKNGSAPLQIWLGKQWLGQKDNHESDKEKNKRFDDITDKLDELIKK